MPDSTDSSPPCFNAGWRIRGREVDLASRSRVMGIVNVTPDSFSDGGHYLTPGAAIELGLRLAGEGADILDVGGESTRPGAEAVSAGEEIRRVEPVIRALRDALPDQMLSIDTSKAEVAEAALAAGADIINDVTAGRGDADLLPLAARTGAGLVLMHMRGTPRTMQKYPQYENVIREVSDFLRRRMRAAVDAGVNPDQLVLDPGIGFGKTLEHNLQLLAGLEGFRKLGRPLLLGVSRKRWLGELTGRDVGDRLAASLAGAAACHQRGAKILRVHDVIETCDMLRILDSISQSQIDSAL
ncbi:MAG: dihydropteroate synthase [Kiritimatiellia bacterium]